MQNNANTILSPFGNLRFLGHLLCRYYPSTSIYLNPQNEPVVVEWIDENDDGLDDFLIYQTTREDLSNYIYGKSTHLDLIQKSELGYHKFVGDIEYADFIPVTLKKIGKKNLPSAFSFFRRSESLDVDSIESELQIHEEVFEDIEYFETLKIHSVRSGTGLFRIHLNNGGNIGHGTVDTKILGEILINFEELYNEMAKDLFRGPERANRLTSTEDENNFLKSSHTEVVIQEAASFSVYLKSKRDFRNEINPELIEDGSRTFEFISDEIFSNVNDVIQESSDKTSLSRIKSNFSPAVFGKVKNLAETIFTHKLVVDMDYYNPTSEFEFRKNILPSKAHGIFLSVDGTSFQNTRRIELIGKFTSINTNTGHFVFRVENGENFSGYFSDLLYEGIASVNFRDNYEVVIEQVKIEYIGKTRVSFRNTLNSYLVR